MTDRARRTDRALGALTGLAIGDALGMPTQLLPRSRVVDLWGPLLPGFVDAPAENEISAGMTAASVTDDTDQALILARLLIRGHGRVDSAALAGELLQWEARMRARGSVDLLGPSTSRALQLVAAGAAQATGRWGDTDGAAMRIAPLGIACPGQPLDRLAERVAEIDRITHDTTVANAGACAVAAAVSAGVAGADLPAALAAGIMGAEAGARRGHHVPGADVAARIRWACGVAAAAGDPLAEIPRLVGTGMATQEAVPAAFAILTVHGGDPWQACLAAASLGGDSDTIAAITGAIAGACHGAAAFPAQAVETLDRANPGLALGTTADALLVLRDAAP